MVGLAQESIASFGANVLCSDASMQSPVGGYAGCGFGFVIGNGVFKWSLSPSAPRYYRVASASALGTLAAVEGKRVGNCQSQQDKYACCKAILGVSLLSDPTEHPLWSFQFPRWDVACRKCAKEKTTAGHVLQGAASVGSFILFKQANARFAKPLQLPGWVDEICDPVEAEASGLRLLKHCQGYLCFVSQ